jgi:pimeloyl-ACP methyl ester carboxylesterase
MSRKFGRYYRVFTVDLRNHGSSPHSGEFNYTCMAEDLRDFMDGHSLRSANLLGHSMGGKAAMQFAVTYPDRVEKLIVVDIAPKDYQPRHDAILHALVSLDLGAFTSRTEIDGALKTAIPENAVRQFLLTNLVRNDAGVFIWRMNLGAIVQNYSEIIRGLTSELSFDKPVLFLKGENSDYIQHEDYALIARVFPLAHLVTISGSGHWVQAEAPVQFLSVVLDFLQSS